MPALEEFFGSAALSGSAITRLTTDWQDEQWALAARDLSGVDYVCIWVDGGHFTVRLDEERLCTLVMVGFVATGPRSWWPSPVGTGSPPSPGADLRRERRRRGMRAPVLAVGDGALGVWAPLREGFRPPGSRDAGCIVLGIMGLIPRSG